MDGVCKIGTAAPKQPILWCNRGAKTKNKIANP